MIRLIATMDEDEFSHHNADILAFRYFKYTANWYNFTFLVPHPNPPPLGEGVYEKRRLCQFAV